MKRSIAAVLLILALALSLTACKNDDTPTDDITPSDVEYSPGVSSSAIPSDDSDTEDDPVIETPAVNTPRPTNMGPAPGASVYEAEGVDDQMNEGVNNNLNYYSDIAGISIDGAIESAYQKYGSYLNDNITKDAIRVGMAIAAGAPFYDENGNISGISSNALKDVNDFLSSNNGAALDKTDPEQSIAALWLAASLYYDIDMYNGIPGYDIAFPFGLARADTSPGSAENEADTFLSVYRSLFHLTDE